jgi:O-antigen biosynthesis protein
VNNGIFGAARGLLTVEEHGAGKEYLRFNCRKRYSSAGLFFFSLQAIITLFALWEGQWVAAAFIGTLTLLLGVQILAETARSFNSLYSAFALLSVNKEIEVTLETIIRKDENVEVPVEEKVVTRQIIRERLKLLKENAYNEVKMEK